MSWEISWVDMCRACMETTGVFHPLYDEFSENDLSSKLTELTSVKINKLDGLPTKLCAKCVWKMNKFYEFKLLVQESDKKLKYMFDDQFDSNLENVSNDVQKDDKNLIFDSKVAENLNNIGEEQVNKDLIQLEPIEEKSFNGNVIKNLNETPNTVVLQIGKNNEFNINSDVQELQFIVNRNDSTAINSTINKSYESSKMQDDLDFKKFSNQYSNLSKRNDLSDTKQKKNQPILLTYSLSKTDGTLIDSNTNITSELDSDSDSSEGNQENIVGSLNDSITKIKEIEENGRVVQYQCTLCLENYEDLFKVLLHIVHIHVPKTGPFYCIICEIDCDSMKQLKMHIKTHRGPTPYKCFLCKKSYVLKRYLKRHMACHTDFPRYRCSKCGSRFKVKSDLEAHIVTHTEAAVFKCSQCPRVFNHKGNYKRHLIYHLDPYGKQLPKFPCSVCNKRFFNNRSLSIHSRIHTGEKPFKCKVCDKRFSQRGNLFSHEIIHTNPRSFTCEVCGKSFNQKSTLRDHTYLHSGEKPHICNVCGLTFTFSSALRRHMWTHSEKKPFECDVCSAKFVGSYDLRRHMKIHTEKLKSQKSKSDDIRIESNKIFETNMVESDSQADTILVEQIFLRNDPIQIISDENSKEVYVDSLLEM